MSKKNTLRTFLINVEPPSEYGIAKIGLTLRADKMLKPLVNLLGIPAMRNWQKKYLTGKMKAVSIILLHMQPFHLIFQNI